MSWLLVSDVDDTLTGDDDALDRLTAALQDESSAVTVAYNSSRPCDSIRATIAAHDSLPMPDYIIGALGTEIENGRSGRRLEGYERMLNRDWQRDAVDELARGMGFIPHAAEYQTPLKASYDIEGEAAYRRFLDGLARHGLQAKVIFSNRIKLDVVPEAAGKGRAIRYLVTQLGVAADHVVVAGDSGNDVDMFVAPFRGIVVGNADEDLRALTGGAIYFATDHHAAGVLEGLRHWGALAREGV